MSAMPAEGRPKPANNAAKRRGFWHGLAEWVDALAAYPAKHAVSDHDLRRVDDDIKRCRQLLGNPQPIRLCAAAGNGGRAVFGLARGRISGRANGNPPRS